MTGAAASVADAMRLCYPDAETFRDDTPDELEIRRRQWGVCLGAVSESLERAGLLPQVLRIAFYQAAGLVID